MSCSCRFSQWGRWRGSSRRSRKPTRPNTGSRRGSSPKSRRRGGASSTKTRRGGGSWKNGPGAPPARGPGGPPSPAGEGPGGPGEAAGKFLHICGSDFYFESFAALCERLAQLAPGKSKKRVFLSNSGTEAVEGAIKLARHSTGRPAIVAFTGAFHGRTYGGLSLTASKSIQRAGFAPFLPEVYHVPYGYRYHCDFCHAEPACTMRCVSSIEDDLFAKRLDPKSVAAVFVEPIQGEGGYVVPPPGYLQALRELGDRHGILLVCDEVQSGIGRTGKMWACEHEGIEPDVLLAAKGLGSGMPIGAIIAKESIMKWQPGAHGRTFGGNPVASAAAPPTPGEVWRELLPHGPRLGGPRAIARDAAAHAGGAGLVVTRDVMVPMRDGVRLATDVYRPPSRPDSGAAAEKLPTILIRTPYDKGFDPYALGPSWAAHGYAVVLQDTRGRYKSEGMWHWLTDDGPDGLDTVDWISHQPWSNGDVGMWGISYLGGTANALAMAGDAHLKSMITTDSVSYHRFHGIRDGRLFAPM